MDTPIFYSALFIHLACLILGFGAVMVIDTFGILWLRKKVKLETVTKVASVTQMLIWIGWTGLVLSGLVLITKKGYIDNLTWIKLFFVAMLGLNGIFLHFIKKSFDKLVHQENIPAIIKFRIGLASTISQVGWWGAMTIGFVHRHWRHDIPWPNNPWMYMVVIGGLFLVVAVTGEMALKKKT